MLLEPFDYFNGVFATIISVIYIIVGLKIILKYFKYKEKNLILVGTVWIIIIEPWIAVAISFLLHILIGIGLTPEIHALVGYTFLPSAAFLWIYFFTRVYKIQLNKLVIIIIFIIETLITIFFLYLLIVDMSLIGYLNGVIDFNYGSFLILLIFQALILFFLTGILFSIKGMKSENLEIKLKGKLLFFAFIFYLVGSILSILGDINIIFLVIGRILTIFSSIEYYCGFILPKWTKKLFLEDI